MARRVEGSAPPRGLLSVQLHAYDEAMCRSKTSPRRDAWDLSVAISRRCVDAHGALGTVCTLLRAHLPHIVELIQHLVARGVPAQEVLLAVVLRRGAINLVQYMVPAKVPSAAITRASRDVVSPRKKDPHQTGSRRTHAGRPQHSARLAHADESTPPCVFWDAFDM
jgi:hypothetical protein